MTDEQNTNDPTQNEHPSESEQQPTEAVEPVGELAGGSAAGLAGESADAPPAAKEERPSVAAKKRSPVERVLVWGIIIILAVLALFEWRARHGFSQATDGISAALKASDESLHDVTLEEAEACIHGAKFEEAPKQGLYDVRVYRWKGLLRTYTLRLQIAQEDTPIVLAMDSNPDPTAPLGPSFDVEYWDSSSAAGEDEEFEEEEEYEEDEEMEEEGEEGEGGGRPSGARQRRSFEDLDADGDGKVTREEAPERMREFFDRIDANKDGAIVKEEMEAARQRRAAERSREEGEEEEQDEEGEQSAESAAEAQAKPAPEAEQPKPAAKPEEAKPAEKPEATESAPKPEAAEKPKSQEAAKKPAEAPK